MRKIEFSLAYMVQTWFDLVLVVFWGVWFGFGLTWDFFKRPKYGLVYWFPDCFL